jgi:D-glycero-D-manno-heptose 1,7-bisphosphate phosphatase
MSRAVFLDRDGVLNRNVYYEDTGAYESPRSLNDFAMVPGVVQSLTKLQDAGYLLFMISNQPNVAKGKSTLDELKGIHKKLEQEMISKSVGFTEFYYCYHHPDSNLAGFGGLCECRKPSPYFLRKAEREHRVKLAESWMVGDRASDIACGRAAGTRTLLVLPDHPSPKVEGDVPEGTMTAKDLTHAVELILSFETGRP